MNSLVDSLNTCVRVDHKMAKDCGAQAKDRRGGPPRLGPGWPYRRTHF